MNTTKQIIAITCAGIICLHTYGYETQFKADFSGGIPPEVILIDGDGNTPATAMANIGFAVGIPWIGYYIDDEDEYVACSTSWYKPAATSDDWMIMPTVRIEPGAVLRWRARSSDKKYFDGYAVYASTDGADRETFDVHNPLYITEAENNQWTEYEIDLSDYVGQDLNVAFVNNSTNKARLYIDDVKVGTNYPLIISLNTPALVKNSPDGNDIIIAGTVISELDDTDVLGDITVRYGDETVIIPNSELKDGACDFAFKTLLHIDADECQTVEVECCSESGESYAVKQNVWSTYRPLFVEEFTATWCSWCIRGIVYMEALKEHYGDMMIPLCVHEGDVMEATDYYSGIDYLKQEGIPNAMLNRKYEVDPAELYAYCEKSKDEAIAATITAIDVDYASVTSQAKVTVDVAFSNTVKDGAYRMVYILSEDSVYQPLDGRYCQRNGYSGGAAGPMGGFENMPSVILPADITYHDVLRGVSEGGPKGVPNSLPEVVRAGAVYSHSYEMSVPETVIDGNELALIVAVLDSRNGDVLNARRLWLKDYDSTPNGGVDDVLCADTEIDVYSLDGIFIGHYDRLEAFLEALLPPGVYIIRGLKSLIRF